MNELKLSDIQYQISKTNNTVIVKCENPLKVESTIYDKISSNWIFAIKVNDKNYERNRKYYIDYLYLSENFEIVKALREDKGVNPEFIIAPDNKVWVSLSSTTTERNGEIVLPLKNREEIVNNVVKRDIGFSYYLNFHGYTYGYFDDIFSPNKPDQIALYEFDKKGHYKNRPMKKLIDISHGTPCILNDRFYITNHVWQNGLCSIQVFELNQKREIISKWKSEQLSNNCYAVLFSILDNGYSFLTHYRNKVDIIKCNQDGKLLDQINLYEDDSRINLIKVHIFDNDFAAINFYREQARNGLIWHSDVFKDIYYPTELGMSLEAIDRNHILESSFTEYISYFKIICTE